MAYNEWRFLDLWRFYSILWLLTDLYNLPVMPKLGFYGKKTEPSYQVLRYYDIN